ncbi:MAG: tRNA uridine-5-carboxymethylaminomethyl(34) synthesis enzyme MnmG [Candidatus Margulisiibacteriota bacterium]
MKNSENQYDVIIIGLGHAGCEAAFASAKLGAKTLAITSNMETIALMPCNPAIGGPGKSHLVSELDALGGIMGLAADHTFVQMKVLNRSRGPAVHSLRSQNDKTLYHRFMKHILEQLPNLDLKQEQVEALIVEQTQVIGIRTRLNKEYFAKSIVITAGTFLNGKIHIGLMSYEAGRITEFPVKNLSENLIENGINLKRLKTGTPPRVDKRTINYQDLSVQPGDEEFLHFSFRTKFNERFKNQLPCYLTYTNLKTHEIILKNLDRSPLYQGVIKGTGPRYCPSIEDKVVRFKERESHQIFIEPEGFDTNETYLQGLNTSLPEDVQEAMVHSMKGLEQAQIIKPGYAIEYDAIDARDLTLTLESKIVANLFFAGQINGTSGYEEAASQGLITGINAALKALGKEPFILSRSESYIGTMIDDITKKELHEPYRMMTARSEFRLLLRQDNAIFRLSEKAHQIGLLTEAEIKLVQDQKSRMVNLLKNWQTTKINPDLQQKLDLKEKITLALVIKRKDLGSKELYEFGLISNPLDDAVKNSLIELKYEGYLDRQKKEVENLKTYENKIIPKNFDYDQVVGIKKESREKLKKYQPKTILEAKSIAGINPVDLQILILFLFKK